MVFVSRTVWVVLCPHSVHAMIFADGICEWHPLLAPNVLTPLSKLLQVLFPCMAQSRHKGHFSATCALGLSSGEPAGSWFSMHRFPLFVHLGEGKQFDGWKGHFLEKTFLSGFMPHFEKHCETGTFTSPASCLAEMCPSRQGSP